MARGKKAAISLSMEFLVVIILSLVLLGMGVTLLYQFVGGAEKLKGELDQRTEEELRRLLIDEGRRVALPLHETELYGGENHVFGIGILNVEAGNSEFYLTIEDEVKFTNTEEAIQDLSRERDLPGWLLYTRDKLVIEQGEHRIEPIMVLVPKDATPGTYIFSAAIKKESISGEKYGNTQKFLVVVK